jgi:hypothetical protein
VKAKRAEHRRERGGQADGKRDQTTHEGFATGGAQKRRTRGGTKGEKHVARAPPWRPKRHNKAEHKTNWVGTSFAGLTCSVAYSNNCIKKDVVATSFEKRNQKDKHGAALGDEFARLLAPPFFFPTDVLFFVFEHRHGTEQDDFKHRREYDAAVDPNGRKVDAEFTVLLTQRTFLHQLEEHVHVHGWGGEKQQKTKSTVTEGGEKQQQGDGGEHKREASTPEGGMHFQAGAKGEVCVLTSSEQSTEDHDEQL